MRLSDIKGERAIEVIGELIDPIANIAEDKEAMSIFQRENLPKGMDAKTFAIARLKKGMPKLLKNHKRDIATILSALAGVTYDEYVENLDMKVFIKDIVELLTDEEFLTFFISDQSGKTSGSVTASSKDSL